MKQEKKYGIWDIIRKQLILSNLTYEEAMKLRKGKERCIKITEML